MSKVGRPKGVPHPESTFPLWRRGLPRLARSLNALKRLEKLVPNEDVPAQLALIDAGLRVNREVRETLLAEMKVRREIVELRKLELDNMPADEIEEILVRTAKRRGYRRVDGIREELVSFFTRSLGPKAAQRMVDRVLPMPKVNAPTKRLDRTIGQSYDRLQEDLDAGVREMKEFLTPTTPLDTSNDQDEPQEDDR